MEKFLRAYSSPHTKQSYQSALSLYFNTLYARALRDPHERVHEYLK